MKKVNLLLITLILIFSACKDRDDFFTLSNDKVIKKFFLRGDGIWNIDEVKFWIIFENDGTVVDEVTRVNAGYFKFNSAEKMDIQFVNDTLDAKYLWLGSKKDYGWNYLDGDFEWTDAMALGQVLTIDKKNMIIFFPVSLNTYTTSYINPNKSVELQFKLSKK